MTKNTRPTDVVTGKVRFIFPHVFFPQEWPGGEQSYRITALISKEDSQTKEAVDAAIGAATQVGALKVWGDIPHEIASPIHDGDGTRPSDGVLYGSDYKGFWVLTASSKYRPGVVDRDCKTIADETAIYGGIFGRVSLRFYPYSYNGRAGVGCGLNHIQKLADGEPLGYSSRPEDDFDDGYVDPDLDV